MDELSLPAPRSGTTLHLRIARGHALHARSLTRRRHAPSIGARMRSPSALFTLRTRRSSVRRDRKEPGMAQHPLEEALEGGGRGLSRRELLAATGGVVVA